jgi:cell division septal protein FtsQ
MEIRKPATSQSSGGLRKKPVSKIAQKRVQRKKTRGALAATLVLVFVVLSIFVLRWSKLFITEINVSGARPEYNIAIQKETQEFLQGSVLYILPRRNIFLLPEQELSQKLKDSNSYIESATLKRKGLNALDVELKERTPTFAIKNSGDNNLFIDNSGVVYSDSEARVSTTTILLQEIGGEYGATTTGTLPLDLANQKGKQLPADYFKNLVRAIDLFKAKNFSVYSVTLRPSGDADLQITPEGGVIRINLYDNIDKTVATFSAARKIETLRTKLSENRAQLAYIDLRFGNKVFYMFSPQE